MVTRRRIRADVFAQMLSRRYLRVLFFLTRFHYGKFAGQDAEAFVSNWLHSAATDNFSLATIDVLFSDG
jgi:hypothetical protein